MRRLAAPFPLLAIVSLGLLLRLIHFSAISRTAFPQIPLVFTDSDMFATWEWAQTILVGDWLGRDTYHPYFGWMRTLAPLDTWYRWWGGREIFQQAPLYAYWVAGLRAWSGDSLTGILAVQLVVGSLHPLVTYCLARRLFDVRVGLLAAAMTAFYGPFIFHQGTLLRDWLPPLLEPLALALILRARDTERARDWVLSGGVLGLALLAKEGLLLFLPLLVLWLALEHRTDWRKAGTSAAWLILGILVVLSPLLMRNVLVGAPPLSISNRTAEGFIEGNAPDGYPIGFKVPQSLPHILERADGRMGDVMRETLRLYQGHWPLYGRLLLLKLRGLADPIEVPNNLDFGYGLDISPVLRFTLTYGLVFPLGLAGLVLSLADWRRHALLLLYTLSTLAGLLLTIVLARYRLVLIPALLVFGAAALVAWIDAIRSRRHGFAFACSGMTVAAVAFQHLIAPIPLLRTNLAITVHGPEYMSAATLYGDRGEFDRAVEEMRRLRRRTEHAPISDRTPRLLSHAFQLDGYHRINWAVHLFASGKADEGSRQAESAEAAYREHLRLAPSSGTSEPPRGSTADPPRGRAFFEWYRDARADQPESEAIARLLQWLPEPAVKP